MPDFIRHRTSQLSSTIFSSGGPVDMSLATSITITAFLNSLVWIYTIILAPIGLAILRRQVTFSPGLIFTGIGMLTVTSFSFRNSSNFVLSGSCHTPGGFARIR
ncbi:hypothetical protein J3458_017738 [Metarhizium acridum]|uniref:uncharacterized protein n=1 Tax=Metarhizium acridum TaxID=92637 RepID=UPI001C6B436E|nr:hypothetical protein J3458_017738 [Metarhizium acridum]